MKFVELAKSLKEGVAPVYLVEGEESYFRDHAVESIRAACHIASPALNDVRYEGDALKGDLPSLMRALETLPFLDEKRLVRAYEFCPSEKEWETHFKAYCASPNPTTVFVIVNAGKKTGAADLRKKSGVTYVDCGREDEEMLARWVFGVAKRKGLAMDGDAASLMVRFCNRDAARMKLETEKLALVLGEGARIGRDAVEAYVAKDTEYKIYELTQAASGKNYARFMEILSDLLQKGYDEHACLSALTGHFRTLYEVSVSAASDAELSKTLGVKPYAVQRNRQTAARLGRERVRTLYEQLYALSSGAKSGKFAKTGALFDAIAKIFYA